ncbi:hypothetical protein BDR26DRAFT_1012493 [Obelidium mucronatum]|nr:hypothetical protein BDR26DRAFT_1012493 [Obelidium mucronatum]
MKSVLLTLLVLSSISTALQSKCASLERRINVPLEDGLDKPNALPIGLARMAEEAMQTTSTTGGEEPLLKYDSNSKQLLFGKQLIMDDRFIGTIASSLPNDNNGPVSTDQCAFVLQVIGRLPIRESYKAEVSEIALVTNVEAKNVVRIAEKSKESFRPYKELFEKFVKVAEVVVASPGEESSKEPQGKEPAIKPEAPSSAAEPISHGDVALPPLPSPIGVKPKAQQGIPVLPQLLPDYVTMVIYLGLPPSRAVPFFMDLSSRSAFNAFFRIRASTNQTDSQLQTLNIINAISLHNETLSVATPSEIKDFTAEVATNENVPLVLVTNLAAGVLDTMKANNVTRGPVYQSLLQSVKLLITAPPLLQPQLQPQLLLIFFIKAIRQSFWLYQLFLFCCFSLAFNKHFASSSEQSSSESNQMDPLFEESIKADKEIEKIAKEDAEAFIRNGTHFLFFGASYCPYTAEFNPMWLTIQKTFYAKGFNKLPGFGIGKIQCADIETFCSMARWGTVDGYPTIMMYKDGRFIEEVVENEAVMGAIETQAKLLGWTESPNLEATTITTRSTTSTTSSSSTSSTVYSQTSVSPISVSKETSWTHPQASPINVIHHSTTSIQMDLSSILPITMILTVLVVSMLCLLFSRRRLDKYTPIRGNTNSETVRYV